ncbi:DUF4129 domain-containing protein [Microbacterium amylolyticum]
MTTVPALAALLTGSDEARERAERELQKPIYAETEPTLFDRVAQTIGDAISSLLNPQIGGAQWSTIWTVIIVGLIVAGVVVALVIWGLPRGEHRRAPGSADVFADDGRSARDLRQATRAAMERSDWDEVVILGFRALARGLEERGIVTAPPGTTARTLAARAATAFSDRSEDLRAAAATFDDVRYLRRAAQQDVALQVVALDESIARTRPSATAEAMFV